MDFSSLTENAAMAAMIAMMDQTKPTVGTCTMVRYCTLDHGWWQVFICYYHYLSTVLFFFSKLYVS